MKQNKRRDKDVSKLVLSAYQVQLINNKTSEFIVKFTLGFAFWSKLDATPDKSPPVTGSV